MIVYLEDDGWTLEFHGQLLKLGATDNDITILKANGFITLNDLLFHTSESELSEMGLGILLKNKIRAQRAQQKEKLEEEKKFNEECEREADLRQEAKLMKEMDDLMREIECIQESGGILSSTFQYGKEFLEGFKALKGLHSKIKNLGSTEIIETTTKEASVKVIPEIAGTGSQLIADKIVETGVKEVIKAGANKVVMDVAQQEIYNSIHQLICKFGILYKIGGVENTNRLIQQGYACNPDLIKYVLFDNNIQAYLVDPNYYKMIFDMSSKNINIPRYDGFQQLFESWQNCPQSQPFNQEISEIINFFQQSPENTASTSKNVCESVKKITEKASSAPVSDQICSVAQSTENLGKLANFKTALCQDIVTKFKTPATYYATAIVFSIQTGILITKCLNNEISTRKFWKEMTELSFTTALGGSAAIVCGGACAQSAIALGATAGTWVPIISAIGGGLLAALVVGYFVKKTNDKYWEKRKKYNEEEEKNRPEVVKAHFYKAYKKSLKIMRLPLSSTVKQIEKQKRLLLAINHPDRYKDNKDQAHEKFCEILTCYNFIKKYRQKYEKWDPEN